MKTSNILIIVTLMFLVSGIAVDKYFLGKAYENYVATNGEQKVYEHYEKNTSFKHIKVDGANICRVWVSKEEDHSGIKYKERTKKIMKKYIKNDTLYISFDEAFRKKIPENSEWHTIRIYNKNLESAVVENTNFLFDYWDVPQFDLEIGKSSYCYANINNMEKMNMSVGAFSNVEIHKKPNVENKFFGVFNIKVKNKGYASFNEFKADKINKIKEGSGKIVETAQVVNFKF